jgi:ABC-2 type transport system permease protein
MTSLLRAELLKIRSVPLLWGVALASLGSTAAMLALQLVNQGRAGTASFGTAQSAVNVLGAGGRSALVAMVAGVLLVTAEFRHRTINATLLVTPGRTRVVLAKLAAAALVGLAIAVATLLLSAGVGLATGAITSAAWNAAVLWTVLGITLVTPLYAVLGAGLGTVVTNQTAAVAVVLIWFLVVETLLGSFGLRWLQPWTPAGATGAVARDPSLVGALPPWAGVVLLLAYGLALAAAGGWRLTRRDIP